MNALRGSVAPLRQAVLNTARGQPKGFTRNMSGGTIEEEIAEMGKWRTVTAIAVPPVLAWSAYTINHMLNHHPEEPENPAYSYLKKNDKRFPWGDGATSLFTLGH
mmetsp:Transcript_30683/g.37222  ORF Transcript_30683/g.37222 Transcript_30683/m.37222 type:complete len:105 (+) Transcript_30683:55-369(+)|eukprot:CAMPEP_0197847574 /NCGR_PEP_ID=MMETSP1438-20131217/6430_1 /TAXON_ID=1461541 /ORGANISM="Pterosperma sp., Strain CCMP1384" /LENGTH=104 /DNA_ID=CAMNT_0043459525 /DNA_START=50 /DNA_END=364 /DNA_ORIENTATION=+